MKKWPGLRTSGAFVACLEEWCEAVLFDHWLHNDSLLGPTDLSLP